MSVCVDEFSTPCQCHSTHGGKLTTVWTIHPIRYHCILCDQSIRSNNSFLLCLHSYSYCGKLTLPLVPLVFFRVVVVVVVITGVGVVVRLISHFLNFFEVEKDCVWNVYGKIPRMCRRISCATIAVEGMTFVLTHAAMQLLSHHMQTKIFICPWWLHHWHQFDVHSIGLVVRMSILDTKDRRFEPQHQYVLSLSKRLYPHCFGRLSCEMSTRWGQPREGCSVLWAFRRNIT